MKKLNDVAMNARRYRAHFWFAVLGVLIVLLVSPVARQNMSLVFFSMEMDLTFLSADIIGNITTTFILCYIAALFFSGRLGEYFGNRKIILIGLTLTILLNFILSFLSSAVFIQIIWGLNGIAQGLIVAPCYGLLCRWSIPTCRWIGIALVIFFSGFGHVLTYFCVYGASLLDPSWSAAFRLPMLVLVLGGMLFFFITKEEPSSLGLQKVQEGNSMRKRREESYFTAASTGTIFHPYFLLLKDPRTICLFGIAIALSIGTMLARHGIPFYCGNIAGMEIHRFPSFLPPILSSVGAVFLYLMVSDVLLKSKREPVLIYGSVLTIILMTLFLFLKAPQTWMYVVMILLTTMTSMLYVFAMDIGTRAFAGTVIGIVLVILELSQLAARQIGGKIIDSGNFALLFFMVMVAFAIVILLSLLSIGLQKKMSKEA